MKCTKFEKARLIGSRTLQIADGAYAAIETDKSISKEIALEEFKEDKIPLKVIKKKN